MKKENKKVLNSKNILVILIIVVIVAIITLIIINPFKLGSKKSKSNLANVEELAEKVGRKYYDTIYYPYVEDKELLLSRFVDSGINLSLKDIKYVIEFDEALVKGLDKYKCDLEKSKVYVYPKKPYGEQDYTIKAQLSCEKK